MARKKEFDETEVLDKALDLFWKKGYSATSIQDLVDTMGINRASIYDTWGDKHNLYVESLKRYRQKSSSWFLNQIRNEQSALQIIRNFIFATIKQGINDTDKKGCFLVNSSTELCNIDTTVSDIVTENRKTMESVLNELIKEGQQNGEIAMKHSSESLSRFLFNTISGLRVLAKGNISEKELNEIVDVTLSALD